MGVVYFSMCVVFGPESGSLAVLVETVFHEVAIVVVGVIVPVELIVLVFAFLAELAVVASI